MKRTKLLYIISGIDYSLGFEWLEKYMDKSRYETEFVFLHHQPPQLYDLFSGKGVKVYFLRLNTKKEYPMVFFKLFSLIRRVSPDIVHCHLLEASLLGLPAAKLAGVKKRVYTRHHSTFHFDYHPRMVKVDRFINAMATGIAAITENVRRVLVEREKVDPRKVFIVHHGFELACFQDVEQGLVDALTLKYNPAHKRPVVGVISRFTEWKGIRYTIEAFNMLLGEYPDAMLILANAKGDGEAEINARLGELPPGTYCKIVFEKEVCALYRIFDIFVHVPVDSFAEAFGQTYVEALAAGIPSVFTLSGIANEFVKDGINALVVPYKNSGAIGEAMKRLLVNNELRTSLVLEGQKEVKQKFPVEVMMNALYRMYEA
ncbi:MAG: glycosyltransferase family 4 protein [Bacteroidia bacterium]|nr:glycosyltransferase family 4 protein [Bacteroidia bacterium]